ncbi:MAG: cytidylate kinase-like family protein [Clostridia bacterium]|nr:cytidylate kinase-like family protein [Clostridia bacterium]
MKIITISREFGSGGREVGKRLADALGFDYYDKEILTAIARETGLNEDYVEKTLNDPTFLALPLHFHSTIATFTSFSHGLEKIDLMVKQTKVLEAIGKRGRDCVVVGRNADVIFKDHHPLNLFICADTESKIARCAHRAEEGEDVSPKHLQKMMHAIDKSRAESRNLITDIPWGERSHYHLTVNTSGWDIKRLVPLLADYARSYFENQF